MAQPWTQSGAGIEFAYQRLGRGQDPEQFTKGLLNQVAYYVNKAGTLDASALSTTSSGRRFYRNFATVLNQSPAVANSILAKLRSGGGFESLTPAERGAFVNAVDFGYRDIFRAEVRRKQAGGLFGGILGKIIGVAAPVVGSVIAGPIGGAIAGAVSGGVQGGPVGALLGGVGGFASSGFLSKLGIPTNIAGAPTFSNLLGKAGSLLNFGSTSSGGGFTASSVFGQPSLGKAFNQSLASIGPNAAASFSVPAVSGILPVSTASLGTVASPLATVSTGGTGVSFLSDLFGGVAKDLLSTGVKSLIQGLGTKSSLDDLSKSINQVAQNAKFTPFGVNTPIGSARFAGNQAFGGLEPGLAAISAGLLAQAGPALHAGQSPESSLAFLSRVTGPLFERQRLSLESRLFNQGLLGSTAGREQMLALLRGQNESLLSNALAAQAQQFNVGQGLLSDVLKIRQLPLELIKTGGTFGLNQAQAFPTQPLVDLAQIRAGTKQTFFSSLGESLGDTLSRVLGGSS